MKAVRPAEITKGMSINRKQVQGRTLGNCSVWRLVMAVNLKEGQPASLWGFLLTIAKEVAVLPSQVCVAGVGVGGSICHTLLACSPQPTATLTDMPKTKQPCRGRGRGGRQGANCPIRTSTLTHDGWNEQAISS